MLSYSNNSSIKRSPSLSPPAPRRPGNKVKLVAVNNDLKFNFSVINFSYNYIEFLSHSMHIVHVRIALLIFTTHAHADRFSVAATPCSAARFPIAALALCSTVNLRYVICGIFIYTGWSALIATIGRRHATTAASQYISSPPDFYLIIIIIIIIIFSPPYPRIFYNIFTAYSGWRSILEKNAKSLRLENFAPFPPRMRTTRKNTDGLRDYWVKAES